MNDSIIEFSLKILPYILIGIWTLYAILVVSSWNFRERFSNFYVIESIPSVFVTLGLLGTFTGIAYGLLHFNTSPEEIKGSIRILLEGLKKAMFTSIYGIILSLIFSKIIKYQANSKIIEPPVSPELRELRELNKNFGAFKDALSTSHYNALVDSLKHVLSNFNNVFASFIEDLVQQNFEELSNTIRQLSEWQKSHKDEVNHLKLAYISLVEKHNEFVNKNK